jgi:hypothetical protein
MHMTSDIRYASFMLRLQWMENDDHPAWVVSMQSTKTGELRWFSNLDALVQFLQGEFGNCAPTKEALSTALPEIEHLTTESLKTDISANE